jgi:hypothetical protein
LVVCWWWRWCARCSRLWRAGAADDGRFAPRWCHYKPKVSILIATG